MTKGKTTLIQKDPLKGTAPSNYRPITCLPMMWKILTAKIREKINHSLISRGIFPDEQKGCCKRIKSTEELLYMDQHILNESKTTRENLAMSWINYKNAYVMVPQSWILHCLKMYKIPDRQTFCQKRKRRVNTNTNYENIQSRDRIGIWHIKMHLASNKKWQTTHNGRSQTTKSSSHRDAQRKRHLQILGNIGS